MRNWKYLFYFCLFLSINNDANSFIHIHVDKCKTAQDFRKVSKRISNALTSSLISTSMGAVAKGIISYSECVACTQGDASAEASRTQAVLQQIFRGAAENPKVLYDFMKILDNKGEPISNQCKGISNATLL